MAERIAWCGVLTHMVPENTELLEALARKLIDDLYRGSPGETTIEIVRQGQLNSRNDQEFSEYGTIIIMNTTCNIAMMGSLKSERSPDFLTPNEIKRGTFVQMVVGDGEFLFAATQQLFSSDGWVANIGSIAAQCVNKIHANNPIVLVSSDRYPEGHFCCISDYVTGF